MSNRKAAWLAWSLWVLGMVIGGLGYLLDDLNSHRDSPPFIGELTGIAALTVGALIISRRPSNRIGWLFLIARLFLAFGGSGNFADQYSLYTFVTRPGALPIGEWVTLLGLITQILGFFPLLTFLPLLFPDGCLPSPRWRPVVWLIVIQLAGFAVGAALIPRLNSGPVDVPNPLGIGAFGGIVGAANSLSLVVAPVLGILSAASVFVRFRHARGDQREQLKWFGLSALLIPIAFALMGLGSLLNQQWLADLPLWQLSVAGIPIAVGIAILKYRLYDIDLIIRRTLIYGALTALLALVYLGSVVLLQQVFRGIAGQESDIAVIISTLGIAALFNPLRHRVQDTIDHRFYRRKYDAQQVLARFAATARDEVEVDNLTGELLNVVTETMQPANASLWLRAVVETNGRQKTEDV